MTLIMRFARAGCDVSHRLATLVRLSFLSALYDLRLGRVGYISPTARLNFVSDGYGPSGTIVAGPGLRLSHGAILSPYGGRITLGENVYIGPYSVLYGHGGLTIGDNVLIAGQCMLIPANHRFDALNATIASQGVSTAGITIADNVWIGSGVQILDGVTIGTGAVIAAGAVVTASIPPYAIAAGVPARVLRYRTRAGDLADGHALRSMLGHNEEAHDGHRSVN